MNHISLLDTHRPFPYSPPIFKTICDQITESRTGGRGLYSLLIGFLEPNLFTFMESVTIFVAVIIGGLASIGGSIMGAAFVILVPQVLGGMKELVPVIFGVTILVILIFEPQGIAGRWLKIRLYFRNWPFR